MTKIQIVAATRHGGTSGIAERIAQVLRAHARADLGADGRVDGLDVVLVDAAQRPDPAGFDAYVIGSGVYLGSWLKEGLEFLERHQATLATKPVWLFSSGPLPGSTKTTDSADPLEVALGPMEGPGSGGHRRIAALATAIGPRDHRVFFGAYDPSDSPKSLPERVVRLMPFARKALPAGDFRDWDAIEAWAHEIAAELTAEPATAVPVG
jgi:menaquinone-dependent protoporphyrinogen oxidase